MAEDQKSATICRVCLNYDSQMNPPTDKGLSLFEEYNDCVISDKINALTNVCIKEGDGLPDKICPTCLLELENAFQFKLKCENTNEVLLSAVNNAPFENLNVTDLVKEEYLEDDELDYVDGDDNINLADLQAADADLECDSNIIKPPKPSKAIDLKLECHDCGGFFKSKCKLRVHWKKVHLTENLKCTNCFRKFKSFAAYNIHKKQNQKSCVTAGKVRIEGEGKNRIFHCKDCSYHSKRIKDMAAHIIRHTGERPYQCDMCPRAFTQLSSLSSHKEGSHNVNIVEGTCHYCGKHIKGRTRLYRHMARHRYKHFPCTICKIVLKTKYGLQNHMKRHTGVKAYTCEMCPTSFFTSSELYNHKSKVHLKSKKYKCGICNYITLSHGTMTKHKPKHSATNIACDVCGYFVDNEQQLVLHKKRHTERNFPCPHCDKTYYSRKNLCAHVRHKHRLVKLSSHANPVANLNRVKSESSIETVPDSSLS